MRRRRLVAAVCALIALVGAGCGSTRRVTGRVAPSTPSVVLDRLAHDPSLEAPPANYEATVHLKEQMK